MSSLHNLHIHPFQHFILALNSANDLEWLMSFGRRANVLGPLRGNSFGTIVNGVGVKYLNPICTPPPPIPPSEIP